MSIAEVCDATDCGFVPGPNFRAHERIARVDHPVRGPEAGHDRVQAVTTFVELRHASRFRICRVYRISREGRRDTVITRTHENVARSGHVWNCVLQPIGRAAGLAGIGRPGGRIRHARRIMVVVIVHVHHHRHCKLPDIRDARRLFSPFFGFRERGQQQPRKNRDDGDDDK